MLTPPSPPFPEVPRADDPPGSDPDRVPRKEPEPDFGEPERSLGLAQLCSLQSVKSCDDGSESD